MRQQRIRHVTKAMPAKPKNSKKTAAAEPKAGATGIAIVRIELTPESKGRIVEASERLGMTQIATLSRLVEWFAGQSPEVQRLVNSGGDSARPILERMAGR